MGPGSRTLVICAAALSSCGGLVAGESFEGGPVDRDALVGAPTEDASPPLDATLAPEAGASPDARLRLDGALSSDTTPPDGRHPSDAASADRYPPPRDAPRPPDDARDSGGCDGGAVAIATGQYPAALLLDDDYVYWENTPTGPYPCSSLVTLYDCPVDACACSPQLLWSNAGGDAGCALTALAAQAGTAYFLDSPDGPELLSCPGSFCGAAPPIYENTGWASSVATDSANVYWSATPLLVAGNSSIYSCPLGTTCASPTLLFDGASYTNPYYVEESGFGGFSALAISPGDVFVSFESHFGLSGIFSVPIAGGAPSLVCALYGAGSVETLLAVPPRVYFTYSGYPTSVYECDASGGGAPSVYATDTRPIGLATDGVRLYWVNEVSAGTVVTCPLGATCTTPTVVASGQDYPYLVAANAKFVYWAAGTNVYRANAP